MLQLATRYTDVRRASQVRPRSVRTARRPAHGLFLPTLTGKKNAISEWFWRELKEGGQLDGYFRREKAAMPAVVRTIARIMHGFKQNPKSDFQRKAAIPAKLYHRWKDEDEHFFDDDANLRSLKRDNPEVCVYVGPRQMPTTRVRLSYGAGANTSTNTKMEDGGLKMAKAENGGARIEDGGRNKP